jgi:Arc/MetJ family transcription regulator
VEIHDMSTKTSTFDLYVRTRLDAWGREFALHRDEERLGHKSKDMLQLLIEHKGEMPQRTVGYKPLTIPPLEWQVEEIVAQIHADAPILAVVLRAYYCGSGRRAVERREKAEELARRKIPRRAYFAYHDLGFQRVAGALSVVALAA